VKHTFVADAQELELPSEVPWGQEKFDAVFSNAAFHWCKRDPLGVLLGVKKYLKPGGRLVVEMGGLLNCIGLSCLMSFAYQVGSSKHIPGIRSVLHEVIRSKGRNPQDVDPWYFPSQLEYEKVKN
jgi:SAM-dependent methyltransferase